MKNGRVPSGSRVPWYTTSERWRSYSIVSFMLNPQDIFQEPYSFLLIWIFFCKTRINRICQSYRFFLIFFLFIWYLFISFNSVSKNSFNFLMVVLVNPLLWCTICTRYLLYLYHYCALFRHFSAHFANLDFREVWLWCKTCTHHMFNSTVEKNIW